MLIILVYLCYAFKHSMDLRLWLFLVNSIIPNQMVSCYSIAKFYWIFKVHTHLCMCEVWEYYIKHNVLTKLCERVILLTNIYNRTVSKAQKGWSKLQYQSVKGIAWIWERNGKCYEGMKTMEYSMAKTSRREYVMKKIVTKCHVRWWYILTGVRIKERIRDMFTRPIHRTMRKMKCEYDNKK